MTGSEFDAWRARLKLTCEGAAEALGITVGEFRKLVAMPVIPKHYGMAANQLEREHLQERRIIRAISEGCLEEAQGCIPQALDRACEDAPGLKRLH
jgi:hypothetical protein